MANGDDGYANSGGGGSVWFDFQVSESKGIHKDPDPDVNGGKHRKRRDGYKAFKRSGWDSFTHILPDRPGKIDGQPADTHPQFQGQGDGYFVITIDDAASISRVEVDGNRLRLYVPVDPALPLDDDGDPQRNKRQVRLAWGLRSAVDKQKRKAFVWASWMGLRDWLLASGAVDASDPADSMEAEEEAARPQPARAF